MTREEALKDLIEERDIEKANRDIWDEEKDRIRSDRYVEMLNIAIKALKQEIMLDKIRAEIDSYCGDNRDRNDGLYIAMRIIDKYNGESEDRG